MPDLVGNDIPLFTMVDPNPVLTSHGTELTMIVREIVRRHRERQ